MRSSVIVAISVLGTLAAGALAAAGFVGSGLYNIGADDHHTKPVFALIQQLRQRSIDVRARELIVPELLQEDATPSALAAALEHKLNAPGEQLAGFRRLRDALGPPDSLERCARFALRLAGR